VGDRHRRQGRREEDGRVPESDGKPAGHNGARSALSDLEVGRGRRHRITDAASIDATSATVVSSAMSARRGVRIGTNDWRNSSNEPKRPEIRTDTRTARPSGKQNPPCAPATARSNSRLSTLYSTTWASFDTAK